MAVSSTESLIALTLALGARSVPGWSRAEEQVAQQAGAVPASVVQAARRAIDATGDPLGDAFCLLRSAEERRPLGAVYTPAAIVAAMIAWAAAQGAPARVVDPGAGSGRFLVAAGRRFPQARLVGIELDPLAALLARGHLAAAGLAERAEVRCADYRETSLSEVNGPTLYIGNPPYVRHHQIAATWKQWLSATARIHGYEASQLAGLHVHFFLATATQARTGDTGVFITAAEWLDVNYGQLVRHLLARKLGISTIVLIEPTADPFPGTATTAAISGFLVGDGPEQVGLRRVATLAGLGSLQPQATVRRERLAAAARWTPFTRTVPERREGFIELGELVRVHRGQVTGANKVWIAGPQGIRLPSSVLYPTVTRAHELFAAAGTLSDSARLRRVIDLPENLDTLPNEERQVVEEFLRFAQRQGAADSYIARHRKAWWSVGLRVPAPILASYMARRPPAFVRNQAEARHLNIAHGLYPRETLEEGVLLAITDYLAQHVSTHEGRTYAGGLTKFEPREMERLLVPHPTLLLQHTARELVA